jgi:hypothetical protein
MTIIFLNSNSFVTDTVKTRNYISVKSQHQTLQYTLVYIFFFSWLNHNLPLKIAYVTFLLSIMFLCQTHNLMTADNHILK